MLTTNAGVGLSLLADVGIDVIVVEHKDRFARFGFTAYQQLLRNA